MRLADFERCRELGFGICGTGNGDGVFGKNLRGDSRFSQRKNRGCRDVVVGNPFLIL